MARPKLPIEKRKQAVTVCVRPDLLFYARQNGINLSQLLADQLLLLSCSKPPCGAEALIDSCKPTGCGASDVVRES